MKTGIDEKAGSALKKDSFTKSAWTTEKKNKINKDGLWEQMKKNKTSYAMLAPYMIFFIVFVIVPVVASVVLSFTTFDLLKAPKFIGFGNYERMFLTDKVFINILRNTLLFAVVTGPVGYILAFVLAWLINELGHKMRMFLTFLFYAPAMMTNIYYVWAFVFSSDSTGIFNGVLISMGVIQEPQTWLSNPNTMVPILCIICLWGGMGAGFLAFIAGFQSQDKSMFEAGAIDGIKNRWQELWYISIPQMAPQLLFGAVMSISSAFSVGGVIQALSGYPTTNYAADTICTYMTDVAQTRFEMGYACSMAVLLLAMMLLANQLMRNALSKYKMD